jgi:DNA polymerase III delta prime subunit
LNALTPQPSSPPTQQAGASTEKPARPARLKFVMNTQRAIFILTANNISNLDKGMKDRCVLAEMNTATDQQLLPVARRVAADMNVVLNDADLSAEIVASHGSLREVMNRVKRLARRSKSKLHTKIAEISMF